jgi:hypothetical protein
LFDGLIDKTKGGYVFGYRLRFCAFKTVAERMIDEIKDYLATFIDGRG